MKHRLPSFLLFTALTLLPAAPALASEQTITIFPSADTYVTGDNNGAANFGTETNVVLFMNFSNTARILMKFDLSNIPRGAVISSATLGMDLGLSTGTQSVSPIVYRVTENWIETSVTQNTQPTQGAEITSGPVTNFPEKKTFDLTEAVRSWVSGAWPNYGIKIIGREGLASTLNYRREFGSRESGTPPTLVVTYTAPTDTRAPTITNVAAAAQADGSVMVTWHTDEPATARVEYGATAVYGSHVDDVGYALEQRVALPRLAAGDYHYRVISADTAGNSAASADYTVTILAAGSTAPSSTTPPTYQPAAPGQLIKTACGATVNINDPCKAVYFVGTDVKRHAFPNDKIFHSWYYDFSAVQTVSVEQLSTYSLGANVRYKPGARLVKFRTDPKVYSVGLGGALQWITSESAAAEFYGANWNTMIDDLSDAFYTNYHFGADVRARADFATGATPTTTINDDLALAPHS